MEAIGRITILCTSACCVGVIGVWAATWWFMRGVRRSMWQRYLDVKRIRRYRRDRFK